MAGNHEGGKWNRGTRSRHRLRLVEFCKLFALEKYMHKTIDNYVNVTANFTVISVLLYFC